MKFSMVSPVTPWLLAIISPSVIRATPTGAFLISPHHNLLRRSGSGGSRGIAEFRTCAPPARDPRFRTLLSQYMEDDDPGPGSSSSTSNAVLDCYDAWNRRDLDAAVACFADSFRYVDGSYFGAFTSKREMRDKFEVGAELLPADGVVVVDAMAFDPENGKIGTRFHVERADGSTLPLTRGCAFYTTEEGSGLIVTGYRATEMVVKPNKAVVDGVVATASKVLERGRSESDSLPRPSSASASADPPAPRSIVEEYFDAWNGRDITAAIDCFAEDCTYETEDPFFVETMRGKTALKEHLIRNADVLPSACRIILDDVAVDPDNGNVGTRWHLEVGGVSLPGLCGCSMYETDKATGLLTSGFDVTEAPVKLPRSALGALLLPLKLGLPRIV